MSTTSANPGRWLKFSGRLAVTEPQPERHAIDLVSGKEVTLVSLLESFREDPSDPVIGPVVITIEPAS